MNLFVSFLILVATVPLPAAPNVGGLGDLKKLQTQVQRVVLEKTETTVSLVSPSIGAAGSGVIVSSDGLILTAAHVIERSKEMTVIFPDGRQERARVLGANFTRDAAMAKLIGPGPWPFAEVGESKSLEAGDFVVAMGHPKGYDPTRRPPVRFGRVMDKGNLDFVTTDCTLIGGDSGGPLFDLKGRVVGIHSHIAPDRRVNNHAGLSGFKSVHGTTCSPESRGASLVVIEGILTVLCSDSIYGRLIWGSLWMRFPVAVQHSLQDSLQETW